MTRSYHPITFMLNKPLPSIGTATGVSAGSSIVTFANDWAPVFQLVGAAIAILSGAVGLLIGLYHLKEIWKKERAKYQGK